MISIKNIYKYLLFFVFSQFLMGNSAFANPVPVFCMAGWLDYNANWQKACSGVQSITEKTASGSSLKKYILNGNTITEKEYVGSSLKKYILYGNSIIEKEYVGSTLKNYILYDDVIIEKETSGLCLKGYILHR